MKNKKYLEDDKPIGKPGKRKTKDWIVEYKWKSLEDFNKYPKSWFRSDTYSEEWRPLQYGNKFITLKSAMQSIDQFIKVARAYNKSDLMTGFYDDRFGKEYRVRNLKTGEIINYLNN